MDLKIKRRAVYTGLRPFLTDLELQAALLLWQQKYADMSTYAFSEFLAAFCITDELKKKRTSILSALLRAIDSPESKLLADPLNEKTGQLQISTEDTAILENHITNVFTRLFNGLIKQTNEKESAKIRAIVIKQTAALKLDILLKKYLNDWLEGKDKVLKGAFEIATLRQMINFCYVAMCEFYGPVKADQLLAQGIAETEAFARDKNVNLHDFL